MDTLCVVTGGQKSLPTLRGYSPMVNLIGAFQDILVSGQWSAWQSLLPVTILAVILCTLGMSLFRRHVGEMVDQQ